MKYCASCGTTPCKWWDQNQRHKEINPPAVRACRCTLIKPQSHLEPAEWEQADDCPVHPLVGQ